MADSSRENSQSVEEISRKLVRALFDVAKYQRLYSEEKKVTTELKSRVAGLEEECRSRTSRHATEAVVWSSDRRRLLEQLRQLQQSEAEARGQVASATKQVRLEHANRVAGVRRILEDKVRTAKADVELAQGVIHRLELRASAAEARALTSETTLTQEREYFERTLADYRAANRSLSESVERQQRGKMLSGTSMAAKSEPSDGPSRPEDCVADKVPDSCNTDLI